MGGAFALATALNVAYVVVEGAFGLAVGSTALLADAAHNLSDVLGLALAWGAAVLAKRKPSARNTYGLGRTTVLAALTNAVLLLAVVGGVAWEAFSRLGDGPTIPGTTVLVVALGGVVINGVSAALFVRGAKTDVNVRGAFLHLLADAAVSFGVAVTGLVLWLDPDLVWLDPVVSILVSLVVLWGTWRLLREALHLTLDGVPNAVDLDAVRETVTRLPGVIAAHDLHVWALSTSNVAMTVHLVVEDSAPRDLARQASEALRERFGIDHCTVQLESPEHADDCVSC